MKMPTAVVGDDGPLQWTIWLNIIVKWIKFA